jgi:hypothetical protein
MFLSFMFFTKMLGEAVSVGLRTTYVYFTSSGLWPLINTLWAHILCFFTNNTITLIGLICNCAILCFSFGWGVMCCYSCLLISWILTEQCLCLLTWNFLSKDHSLKKSKGLKHFPPPLRPGFDYSIQQENQFSCVSWFRKKKFPFHRLVAPLTEAC